MEFMVRMDITFPASMSLAFRDKILSEESEAAAEYLDSGQMIRVWREHGTHNGNHGHLALWDAPDRVSVAAAYRQFPLVQMGYGIVSDITELQVNPNDRTTPAISPLPLTYASLDQFLMLNGAWSNQSGEGLAAEIAPGVTIHDHPHSGRPREIHFMVDGQKIAEIGPESGSGADVALGYIDLLAEWDGKPVRHDSWKNAILRDNGLLHPSHEAAKNAPRIRREIA